MSETLSKIQQVLNARKDARPDKSYVASLYARGLDKILEKIGEEATELIIAAKNENKDEIIHETADLWFHSLVLLEQNNIEYSQILDELETRFSTSGIEEKATR